MLKFFKTIPSYFWGEFIAAVNKEIVTKTIFEKFLKNLLNFSLNSLSIAQSAGFDKYRAHL